MIEYTPKNCDHCGQTTTYTLAIDKGTVEIVKAIALFIQQKGINCVHPRKEMEGTFLTSNQVGNLSRPRLHGLIASVRGEPGNYLLTTKGAKFLHGEQIPKVAIIQKGTEQSDKSNIGYWEEYTNRCTVHDFTNTDEPYWEHINYTIEEGRIIYPPEIRGIEFDYMVQDELKNEEIGVEKEMVNESPTLDMGFDLKSMILNRTKNVKEKRSSGSHWSICKGCKEKFHRSEMDIHQGRLVCLNCQPKMF